MALTVNDITNVFNDEAAAYQLLESIRWPDGPVCPHCGSTKAYFLDPKSGTGRRTRKATDSDDKTSTSYRRVWKCASCRKQYSVLKGSVFEGSHIPVCKWLWVVHEMCTAKNGVAAYEVHRKLGLSQKAAWFMCHRIRYAMGGPILGPKLQGVVEADETYIGGAAKNMHKADRERRITGRGTVDKIPVVTLVQRGGEARSQVMRAVTEDNVRKVLREHVSRVATLMTDTAAIYAESGKDFAGHETVDHSAGEDVRGVADTNSAEGFFGQLKRSINGTHHHVSEQHLQHYLGEFDFRYSTRKMSDVDRSERAIWRAAGKRLSYR